MNPTMASSSVSRQFLMTHYIFFSRTTFHLVIDRKVSVIPRQCQPEKWPNEIVFDMLGSPLSFLLIIGIGAKLTGRHNGI